MSESGDCTVTLSAEIVGFGCVAALEGAGACDVIDRAISAHNGRALRRADDGALAEFRLLADAARCATEIQTRMAERNADLPADRRVVVCVGLRVPDAEKSDGAVIERASVFKGLKNLGPIRMPEPAFRLV